MSAPALLKFHQKTFALLQETPIVSPTNVRLLKAWEKNHRVRLPAAIREWYSLEGAERRGTMGLSEYPLDESIRPILADQTWMKQDGGSEPPAAFNVGDIGTRCEDVLTIAPLDGTDDPVVVNRVEEQIETYPFGKRLNFSEFVFRSLWNFLFDHAKHQMRPILVAIGTTVGPIEMDFLFESLEDLFRERRYRGRRLLKNPFKPEDVVKLFPHRFAFRHALGYLALWCQGNPLREHTEGKWFLLGNSDRDLLALAKLLWPCCDFSRLLTAATDTGKVVLNRLRRYYQLPPHK